MKNLLAKLGVWLIDTFGVTAVGPTYTVRKGRLQIARPVYTEVEQRIINKERAVAGYLTKGNN